MKVPVVRSISLLGLCVALLPLVVLLILNAYLLPQAFPIVAAVVWVGFVLFARATFTRGHRRGIRCVKSGRFAEAIPHFERAYRSVVERPWIDRFRWILLGGSSRWTYREMALCNVAFCYGQIGKGDKMREAYQKALAEFPNSVLAGTAMRMITATQTKAPNQALQTTPVTRSEI
jgi:hypothetical protein